MIKTNSGKSIIYLVYSKWDKWFNYKSNSKKKGVKNILYLYADLPHELTVTYTQVLKEHNSKKILVHFEQPTDYGFKEARYSLPNFKELYNYNFTKSETLRNLEFLKQNAESIIKHSERKSRE